jgi:hypothetical protein
VIKAKLQALMAVARKMLHAIFGMFHGRSGYDGSRLFLALPSLRRLKERGSPAPPERNNAGGEERILPVLCARMRDLFASG